METQENFNGQDSLKIINEMIGTAKHSIGDKSFHYLLWGWLVLIASVLDYYLLTIRQTQYHWLPWPILMGTGGILAFVFLMFQKRKETVKTYFETFLGYTWTSVIIALFLTAFIGSRFGSEAAYPVIMIVYGMGLFVSGMSFRFTPLVIGSICCWCCALAASFVTYDNQLILLGLSVLSGYIIPGHILKIQFKHETA
ncbi:MAG: hypothetical protein NT040_12465 [Bacteroidetes bacterium]|nr:hypothetical protein [Bacteroidota bacterium]